MLFFLLFLVGEGVGLHSSRKMLILGCFGETTFILQKRNLLILLGVYCGMVEMSCLLPFPSGTPIKVGSGKLERENGNSFEWDFCEGVEKCGSLICEIDKEGNYQSCGNDFEFKETSNSEPLTMIFNDGETDGCGGVSRHTEVHFICGNEKSPNITEISKCNYILQLHSPLYCSSPIALMKEKMKDIKEKKPKTQKEVKEPQSEKEKVPQIDYSKVCEYQKFEEITREIHSTTYIVNLCDRILGCEGGLVCQLLPDGRAKSLGSPPLIPLGNNQYQVQNGTQGCHGKFRSTILEFPPSCHSSKPTILKVVEISPCKYKLVMGDPDCGKEKKAVYSKPEAKPSAKGKKSKPSSDSHENDEFCHVKLLRTATPREKCIEGKTFGCSGNQLWVSSSCSGTFRCNGRKITCYWYSHQCKCT